MKNRIQKLADKAKKSVPHGLSPEKWIEVYNQKFAELIVRECIYAVENGGGMCGVTSSNKIKQYFGVEQ